MNGRVHRLCSILCRYENINMTHNVLRARNYTPPPHYVKIYMQACTVAQVSTERKILHELHRNRVYCIVLRAETNGKKCLSAKEMQIANGKWLSIQIEMRFVTSLGTCQKEFLVLNPKFLAYRILSQIYEKILFCFSMTTWTTGSIIILILMHVNDFWNSVLRKWKLLTAKEKRAYNLTTTDT